MVTAWVLGLPGHRNRCGLVIYHMGSMGLRRDSMTILITIGLCAAIGNIGFAIRDKNGDAARGWGVAAIMFLSRLW